MTYQSKFDLKNCFLYPLSLAVILTACTVLIAYFSYLEVLNGKVETLFKTPIYGSLILLASVILLVVQYANTLKILSMDEEGISVKGLFQKTHIPWGSIQKIDLFGHRKIMGRNQESILLELKNDHELVIPVHYYHNHGILRKVILQATESISSGIPIQFNQHSNILSSNGFSYQFTRTNASAKFSGNPILNSQGILMIILILGSGFIVLFTKDSPDFWPISIGCGSMVLFVYGTLGNQLHYFHLDHQSIFIRNHWWPWVEDRVEIQNIKEVIFEWPYRQSKSLRLITWDYETKVYPAGSLREKTWKNLERELIDLKVPTRKEPS